MSKHFKVQDAVNDTDGQAMRLVRTCPCCNAVIPECLTAYRLLGVVEELDMNLKPGQIIVAPDAMNDTEFARVKLALALSMRPAGFQFRALAEEWTMERIVREMY